MRQDNELQVVAVVDDDRRILDSIGSLLESAGYEPRLYSSPEALLNSEGGIAELSCLITDIGMPTMDGFELRRVARAAKPGLPVILITGRDDLAKLAGASGELFRKPFNGPELLAAVKKAVGWPAR